jgi:hypothetical protein
MTRHVLLVVSIFVLVAACGDAPDSSPPIGSPRPGPDSRDIVEKLRERPGIVSAIEETVPEPWLTEGARFFVLEIAQPVDHDVPQGATFPRCTRGSAMRA